MWNAPRGTLEFMTKLLRMMKTLTQQDTSDQTTSEKREYVAIDTLVHSFCKLLGTPEYGQGVSFRDFIAGEFDKATYIGDASRSDYLQNVLKTNLARQVGSRYFVTAYNAARIYFLHPAALEFLEDLSKRKSLNRLEQYVLTTLKDPVMIGTLRIDGLFFYHIYADLTALVKSKQISFGHEHTLLRGTQFFTRIEAAS